MAPRWLIAMGAGAGLHVLASCFAAAQDPESRIDSTPRIVLRPPADAVRGVPHVLPGPADEDPPPATRSDRDRRLDFELEVEARKAALRREEGGEGRDLLAAAACVVGSAALLLGFLVWASRRRGR